MKGLTEIRWHARAGQGAKTAAHTLALALMAGGKSVQAFPEYGPERRGAPLRAFTRFADRPIRRHDSITDPDLVVVLEPSLVHEVDVLEGLAAEGRVLLSGDRAPQELNGAQVRCIHATKYPNLVMLGAVAATLGQPTLEAVQEAAVGMLGRKLDADEIRGAVAEGFREAQP